MNRTTIINSLILQYNYQSYLEIGLGSGCNYQDVRCDDKTGVDPTPPPRHAMTGSIHATTSDEFFAVNERCFDIVFIDGLHHADQVYRDIENSLLWLSEGGIIVCHDMMPVTELQQRVPRETKAWTGDCWRALVRARGNREIEVCVVDTDWGCGLIKPAEQPVFQPKEELAFENFQRCKHAWLNVISVAEFKIRYLLSQN
ncbi:class I SAM-dependent methyltransferase [Allorhodopirellula solitaria]|uniref:class I SAM-dependent methyltransferase n=1 Tax=Allorhodopirellula solitaria TaxID=2527987 RepID=UPI0011B587B8|nr:class I SAM-dependent methyltransferase [Allorhodopirellula solitaria]